MYVDKRCCGLFAQQVFCWPMSAQMDNVAADFAELKEDFLGSLVLLMGAMCLYLHQTTVRWTIWTIWTETTGTL